MKTPMYSIYDTASGVYTKPWQALTDAQAMREFSDIVAMPDSAIGKHPEHYYLCRIGDFNDATAELTQQENETLLTGLETLALITQQAHTNFEHADRNNGEEKSP